MKPRASNDEINEERPETGMVQQRIERFTKLKIRVQIYPALGVDGFKSNDIGDLGPSFFLVRPLNGRHAKVDIVLIPADELVFRI